MCGIYGFIGKPTKNTGKLLHELGILNEIRGTDSAGIMVTNGRHYTLTKKAVSANILLAKTQVRSILSSIRYMPYAAVIGHTRAATRGIVNDDNAHPFKIGHYIFAHNGVISNFDLLQGKFKTDYAVDSQMIGHLLNTAPGNKAVFENYLTGWLTVPYFNTHNPKQLYIATYDAPLAIFITHAHDGVYYSSLFNHLKTAVKSTGLHGQIVNITAHKLYTFTYTHQKIAIHKTRLYRYVPTSLTPTYTYYYGKSGAYNYEEDYSSFRSQYAFDDGYPYTKEEVINGVTYRFNRDTLQWEKSIKVKTTDKIITPKNATPEQRKALAYLQDKQAYDEL